MNGAKALKGTNCWSNQVVFSARKTYLPGILYYGCVLPTKWTTFGSCLSQKSPPTRTSQCFGVAANLPTSGNGSGDRCGGRGGGGGGGVLIEMIIVIILYFEKNVLVQSGQNWR